VSKGLVDSYDNPLEWSEITMVVLGESTPIFDLQFFDGLLKALNQFYCLSHCQVPYFRPQFVFLSLRPESDVTGKGKGKAKAKDKDSEFIHQHPFIMFWCTKW